ncbi:transmembrane protein 220 isoform X1 [Trachinotus anak]|uniref:transmembrane protein 220 isoform X1 n=1 Tax=Trachinotus anak TaxID=443729 RepID=UPI0039F219C2
MGEVRQAPGSGTRLVGMWKVCNVLMSLFFALAAYVQINDPDAGLWMVGYGVPAVLCAGIGWKPQVTEQVFVLKAPPGGCVVSVQLSAEQLITDQCTVTVVVAETLPWRRVADLHVMTSAAAAAALGWALREEPVTHILQQEQGRYCSWLQIYWITKISSVGDHVRIFWPHADACLASPVSPLREGSGRDAQSLHSCRHHSLPSRGLAVLPHQQGAESQLAFTL